jgi:hypothetical protein
MQCCLHSFAAFRGTHHRPCPCCFRRRLWAPRLSSLMVRIGVGFSLSPPGAWSSGIVAFLLLFRFYFATAILSLPRHRKVNQRMCPIAVLEVDRDSISFSRFSASRRRRLCFNGAHHDTVDKDSLRNALRGCLRFNWVFREGVCPTREGVTLFQICMCGPKSRAVSNVGPGIC